MSASKVRSSPSPASGVDARRDDRRGRHRGHSSAARISVMPGSCIRTSRVTWRSLWPSCRAFFTPSWRGEGCASISATVRLARHSQPRPELFLQREITRLHSRTPSATRTARSSARVFDLTSLLILRRRIRFTVALSLVFLVPIVAGTLVELLGGDRWPLAVAGVVTGNRPLAAYPPLLESPSDSVARVPRLASLRSPISVGGVLPAEFGARSPLRITRSWSSVLSRHSSPVGDRCSETNDHVRDCASG